MKKIGVNKFPFHPYFNILLVALLVTINLVGFYFLINQFSFNSKLFMSEIYFYLFFIVAQLGILLLQFFKREVTKLSIIIFLISLVLYGTALVLRIAFEPSLTYRLVSQGLAVGATMFAIMAIELYTLQVSSNAIINDSEYFVVTERDLTFIRGITFFVLLVVSVIPFFILQEFALYDQLLWLGTLALAVAFFGFGNYRTIMKHAIVGNEDDVLEYRSIVLYLRAAKRRVQVLDKEQESIDEQLGEFSDVKAEKIAQKNHYQEIEASKPALVDEIAQLSVEIEAYNIDGVKTEQEQIREQQNEIRNNIWQERFEEKFINIENELKAMSERLTTTKSELETAQKSVTDMEQDLDDIQYQLEDDIAKQERLKAQHSDLETKQARYQDELEFGGLDEKEATKMRTKLEKTVERIHDAHTNINELEAQIDGNYETERSLKQKLQALRETEIPDYQYTITTLTDQIKTSETQKQEIEQQFEEAIHQHEAYQNLQERLRYLKEQEAAHDTLVDKRSEKQKIVDIDCEGEIAKIDEAISNIEAQVDDNITQKAAAQERQRQLDNSIRDFLENKKRLITQLKENE